MISPVRYSGRSGSSSHASVNINSGPISQFSTSDITSERRSTTLPMERYFTFASTGYIIANNPIAIGSDTVSSLTASRVSSRPVNTLPNPIPNTIANPIHTGRKRSSSDNRATTACSSDCVSTTVSLFMRHPCHRRSTMNDIVGQPPLPIHPVICTVTQMSRSAGTNQIAAVASLEACDVRVVDPDKVAATRDRLPSLAETDALADWFKVLGDATRARILYAVLEAGELCVCDLAATVNVAESTVSHALRWLRGAGVVRARRAGKMMYYRLDDEHVRMLLDIGREHLRHRDGGR